MFLSLDFSLFLRMLVFCLFLTKAGSCLAEKQRCQISWYFNRVCLVVIVQVSFFFFFPLLLCMTVVFTNKLCVAFSLSFSPEAR